MKTVVLCGGLGTRISEETHVRPKPMVEIGGKPILWHIMNIYSHYGHKDFVLALGFKQEYIKQYFLNYHALQSDFCVDLGSGEIDFLKKLNRDWKVSLVDTGLLSMTGGRLYRLRDHLKDEDTFMLTYGDGLSNVDIGKLVEFHRSHGKIATVTSVRPNARFGEMVFDGERVVEFKEKPQATQGWINGGFFVFNKEIFNYLGSEKDILEQAPLESLVKDEQLMAYWHDGFWQCMDTMRDKNYLNELWDSGSAPWAHLV